MQQDGDVWCARAAWSLEFAWAKQGQWVPAPACSELWALRAAKPRQEISSPWDNHAGPAAVHSSLSSSCAHLHPCPAGQLPFLLLSHLCAGLLLVPDLIPVCSCSPPIPHTLVTFLQLFTFGSVSTMKAPSNPPSPVSSARNEVSLI